MWSNTYASIDDDPQDDGSQGDIQDDNNLIHDRTVSDCDAVQNNDIDTDTDTSQRYVADSVVKFGRWLTAVVLVVNSIILIVAVTKSRPRNGISQFFTGSCSTQKTGVALLHLLINILSTLLFSTSNTFAQVLNSPSRTDVDKAHARRRYCDIGVLSFRNFFYIPGKRTLLCLLLFISSIPLHLVYNAAIVSGQLGNSAMLFVSTSDVEDLTSWKGNSTTAGANPAQIWNNELWNASLSNAALSSQGSGFESGTGQVDPTVASQVLIDMTKNFGSLKNLSNTECIKSYEPTILNQYSNVIIVTNAPKHDSLPIIFTSSLQVGPTKYFGSFCPYNMDANQDDCNWAGMLAGGPGSWEFALSNDDDGSSTYVDVTYCLAKPVGNEQCSIGASVIFLPIVIACNIIKLLCFGVGSWAWDSKSRPMLVVGDAVASFLSESDPLTRDVGCMSSVQVQQLISGKKRGYKAVNQPWKEQQHRWYKASSKRMWTLNFFFMFIALCFVGSVITLVDQYNGLTLGGFGKMYNFDFVGQSSNVAGTAILANLPQLVLALFYLLQNNILTRMLICREYTNYARLRKPLRVSLRSTNSAQRATHYLNMPWKYALPFLITSILLHWFASQGLFPVNIQLDSNNSNFATNSAELAVIDISPIAVILFTVTIVIFAASVLFLGVFRTYIPGIALARCCSFAISAACHPSSNDGNKKKKEEKNKPRDDALWPVKYGVLGPWTETKKRVGFSAGPVGELIPGEIYS